MTGDPWLALAHDLGQFADRQFGFPKQQEQAQPRGIAHGAQHCYKIIHLPLRPFFI
jgi:hypothetical protein